MPSDTLTALGEILRGAGLAPLRAEAELHTRILEQRLALLPALMGETGIDFWLILGTEYNEDPIMRTLFTWDAVTARRTTALMLWLPEGASEVRRFTIGTRTPTLDRFFEAPGQPGESLWQGIARVVAECAPRAIAVNRSEAFGPCDGLTATLERPLLACLPEGYADCVISAEPLAVRWLETLAPLEIDTLNALCRVTHGIIEDGFFGGHIVPGMTTTDDIEWHMRETIHALGLSHWFGPDVDLQRRGGGGLIAGAGSTRLSGVTVQRGDLLHCDIGVTGPFVRLHTDVQRIAYVPLEGETAPPRSLQDLLALGNRFQDIVMAHMATGKTGNAVFEAATAQARAEGLTPMLYTHPLGLFGHGCGPKIGRFDQQFAAPGTGELTLHGSTAFALELNICAPLPEWDDQPVYIYLEEDIVLDTAPRLIAGRQTELECIPLP